MGQPRASRRKIIAISSDEEDEYENEALPSDPSEGEKPAKPQKQSTGKLKPVKKSSKAHQPKPPTSTQNGSSQKSPGKSPGKSKASKTKNKPVAKDEPKANGGRTIFSFFNAATQRQTSSQLSASPEKRSTPQEQTEAIHDDSEDGKGSDLQLAKGSSTALALGKRKVHQGESFESETGVPPASQKFRKTNSGDRMSSLSIFNEDKRPWTEQFAPKDLTELAVHKKKVSDVRQWLELALNGRRQRALVLKGAAGTGKTTTLRLLAQDLGLRITEWKNPAGVDLTAEGSLSTAAQFEEFVSRAGRSGGLQFVSSDAEAPGATKSNLVEDRGPSHGNAQLLLVEEFPNTFSRTSSTLQSFRSAISQYLSSPTLVDGVQPTPIVMVISETLLSTNTALADSFTAHRLLGPELNNHPYLDTIEFNAVAPTILTKAMETIVVKEARKSGRRRTPGSQVLKHLAENGDVRSAVGSLEFLCLRGDDENAWSSKVTFTKQKRSKTEAALTQAESEALRLISNRESTLGIFHAVGKVVYNKRIDSPSIPHPPPWLPQHRRTKVPENDVGEMIDELGTDTSTFIAALHENYALSCGGTSSEDALDSMLGCIGDISDADLLSIDRFSFGTRAFSGSATDSLRQDEMAFQVAVRGLLFSLPHPVHRSLPADGKRGDAHRMFYPAYLKLWKKREEIEGVLELLTSKFQTGSLAGPSRDVAKAASNPKGVESWKTNQSLDTGSTDESSESVVLTTTNSAKTEMLIERLPYMSQVMGSKTGNRSLADQIARVTRVGGSAPIDEDDEADVEEDELNGAEQWTTDRPEGEGIKKPTKKRKIAQSKLATEGGGLAIPIESRVEKLVLEYDDIVDD
ncbi:RFC checkpoint protein Rad17 [Vermiconidia calcicola]|uniref:RFC checkpoint protein Rad17 n=1 Tax=Vermiconidia calcicola TaxID=1690605 RepID=A0ACC3MVV3_9PEZI|nr:RFC checkpoint protein Rad17 [Vermiconidia calcicola]